MPEKNVDVGPEWTLLTSSEVVTITFQNRGQGVMDVSVSDTSAPGADAISYQYPVGWGEASRTLSELFPGSNGGRLWARSLNGTRVSLGWTV